MTSASAEMDTLRLAVGEVEALAAVLRDFYDASDWNGFDQQLVGRVGHMIGLLAASAATAVGKVERFEIEYVDAQPAPAGQPRADKGESMSPEDAAIVRRIRTQCPDRRFDGGTDAELLDLFKHNRQVLARSDEDVIAVMTRPR